MNLLASSIQGLLLRVSPKINKFYINESDTLQKEYIAERCSFKIFIIIVIFFNVADKIYY